MRKIKRRFILTMNDTRETRACYGRAGAIEAVDLSYQLADGGQTRAAREIVIRSATVD